MKKIVLLSGMRAPVSGRYRRDCDRVVIEVKRGAKMPPAPERGARYVYIQPRDRQ